MTYSTRISRHQVLTAFDLIMKRRAAEAWKNFSPNYHSTLLHPPQLSKKTLPPGLTMKAIALHCGISYWTLSRLYAEVFVSINYNRPRLVGFAKRWYRP